MALLHGSGQIRLVLNCSAIWYATSEVMLEELTSRPIKLIFVYCLTKALTRRSRPEAYRDLRRPNSLNQATAA